MAPLICIACCAGHMYYSTVIFSVHVYHFYHVLSKEVNQLFYVYLRSLKTFSGLSFKLQISVADFYLIRTKMDVF